MNRFCDLPIVNRNIPPAFILGIYNDSDGKTVQDYEYEYEYEYEYDWVKCAAASSLLVVLTKMIVVLHCLFV